ncbi:2-keto-3-deoxy-phosphogluconate aldolase [Tistlia consotensis]|uniref:2-dehydro-3-deoxy-phosphogluconate aldolase n=1 Tax=Tistlia consotensis USBA 355 TaxID=560819 RepID=A0A1Y6BUT9_9PROT|nr:bifunctional 4-hydroxy-2-oxoglutarate aldolase/2-dehydro-3-deoxy-phosphogluconate aldolase [Tistlia consotensis]SMF29617.1 2-keto-3-deoxy-phosphogluconate aldolase [Tistlia consotensis USBA 355]SNR91089.1 2-keto-3-deoxy-phosphogluconate aldolase [Tistlia consotensis]
MSMPLSIAEVCRLAPVVPVLVVEEIAHAAPLARALVAGGLKALEVTLRTPAALEAIRIMAEAAPGAVVGAGTLRSPADVRAAREAGARFGVSPGLSARVLDAAEEAGLPMLPGVATPSEAMAGAERGLEILKFFPAEANGGVPVLEAWASPLKGLSFCPTGGIGAANAPDYLRLPNVLCVGGSWVAPRGLVAAGDWAAVTALARTAAGLGAVVPARA